MTDTMKALMRFAGTWLPFVVLTIAVTVTTAWLITMQLPERYRATTSLVINFQTDNPFESALPAQLSNSYMSTQLDILRSRKVADNVVSSLSEQEQRQLAAELLPASVNLDSPTLAARLSPQIRSNLVIEPSRDSRVVEIGYESTSRELAARLANAYVNAYMAVTLELNVDPARRNAAWFEEQLTILRARLQAATSRLTAFQRENGIVALDERLDTEASRLNEQTRNLVTAQAEKFDVQSRQLGRNHPEYLRAVEREQAILRSLENQKRQILQLREQRDQLELLARDVESEQRNYEATLQNFYRTSLESQFNQTNVSILSEASLPSTPFSPNLRLNLLSAAFLGLILGLMIAVLWEMLNRRIRVREDVNELLGLEVLGTI